MKRLNYTFQTLAASPSEAAISVLGVALVDPEPKVRALAVSSLAKRTEKRSGEMLLRHWFSLTNEQTLELRAAPGQLVVAVAEAIQTGSDLVLEAISAVGKLHRVELLPQLVGIVETHALNSTRQTALQAVIELADLLGSQARGVRDPGAVRAAATSRLAESIQSFPVHRCNGLVDAFLLASTSKDTRLIEILASESVSRKVVLNRFAKSDLAGVSNLLASFIRRTSLPPVIVSLLTSRSCSSFRSALLQYVSADPGSALLNRISEIGRPASCEDNPANAAAMPVEEHAALLHVIAQTSDSPKRLLRFAVSAIRRDEQPATDAAVHVLARCETPGSVYWIKAAIELAGDFDARVTLGDDAMLLGDLVDLLSHGQSSVVKSIQRVLAPLHAEAVFPYLTQLDPKNRNRLGRILMMIDPAAVDVVRDRLRHPIMKNRIEGIAAAESLGIVDLLLDSFTHLVQNDHQEARRAAAAAMAHASSKETLDLLQDMIAMPESSARDEAVRSMELRTRVASPLSGLDDFFASTPVTL